MADALFWGGDDLITGDQGAQHIHCFCMFWRDFIRLESVVATDQNSLERKGGCAGYIPVAFLGKIGLVEGLDVGPLQVANMPPIARFADRNALIHLMGFVERVMNWTFDKVKDCGKDRTA